MNQTTPKHVCCCGSTRCEEGPPPDCAEWLNAEGKRVSQTTDDEAHEYFATSDIEFLYEHGVGLTVHTHRTDPWLSWDETKELAGWLAKMIHTVR